MPLSHQSFDHAGGVCNLGPPDRIWAGRPGLSNETCRLLLSPSGPRLYHDQTYPENERQLTDGQERRLDIGELALDPYQIRRLEEHLASAVSGVLESHFPDCPRNPRLTHLMAKAAVAVLEAVVDKSGPGAPRPAGS